MSSDETKPLSHLIMIGSSLIFHITLGYWMSSTGFPAFIYFFIHPILPVAAFLGILVGFPLVIFTGFSLGAILLVLFSLLSCFVLFESSRNPKQLKKKFVTSNLTAWTGVAFGIAINIFIPALGSGLLDGFSSLFPPFYSR